MTDLNALVMFAKVAEAQSFSAAARRMHVPVSTLSRRVAELEAQMGVRLLERSTRTLRLTEVGAEVLEHARRGVELREAVESVVSDHRAQVSGTLRLSAPPSISDSLLAPLVGAFQMAHPEVRVQVFVTDRIVDQLAEGVDLGFRVGELRDSSLVARRILRYRHQLLASPAYLRAHRAPREPRELLRHRLLAFSFWKPVNEWAFVETAAARRRKETLRFEPYLSMNDYAGLAVALLAGVGIGELPPLVQPELLREGRLVEVMPRWGFRQFPLSVVHVGGRLVPRAVRVFKQFAVEMAPRLFPELPM